MRSLRAGIAAILLVAVMGITLSGCSNDKDSVESASNSAAEVSDNGDADNSNSDNSASEDSAENGDNSEVEVETEEDPTAILVQEATFIWGTDEGSGNDDTQDPTEAPEPEVVVVTEYVAVTEAGGEQATDAAGETVTEVVTQTQTEAVTYVPAMDNFRSYWLDMVKKNGEYNKVFNGEFLVVTFKIKEGTPDGNYPITFGEQDFVNWEEEQLDVKTVDGYVTVGDAIPTAAGQAQPGQFTIQAKSVTGKAGDEVEVIFNVNDNPGLVGYVFNFEYDKNALEIVDARIGSDCEGIIDSVND
ncbi:MAG: hypothetical protein IJ496_06085 [Ruminococcus sp.]|nr:hypothetical protein [Ruminococcus sp.]